MNARSTDSSSALGPALLVSTLLHLSAGGALLWWQDARQSTRVGAPVVSVSLIDAVEAHRPRPEPQPLPPEPEVVKPLPQPAPVVKRPAPRPLQTTPLPPEPPRQQADDELESLASLSTPVKAPAEAPALSVASFNADYLHNPKPQYPALSRRLGEQGRVLLHVQVSVEGKALAVSVKESSGFKRLDEAAVTVVKQWQFVPAKQGNTALVSWVDVPLQFSLEK